MNKHYQPRHTQDEQEEQEYKVLLSSQTNLCNAPAIPINHASDFDSFISLTYWCRLSSVFMASFSLSKMVLSCPESAHIALALIIAKSKPVDTLIEGEWLEFEEDNFDRKKIMSKASDRSLWIRNERYWSRINNISMALCFGREHMRNRKKKRCGCKTESFNLNDS